MYHGHYAYPVSLRRPKRRRSHKAGSTFFVSLLCALSCLLPAYANNNAVEGFKEWHNRLARGEHEAWKEYQPLIAGQPLSPYLHYLQLNAELSDFNSERLQKEASHDRVRAFLEVWPNLPISDNLERQWLRRLGKEKDWSALLAHDIRSRATDIQCLRLQASYITESARKRKVALNEAKKLWMQGHSLPKLCDGIFEALGDEGRIKTKDYLQRSKLAIMEGNAGFARWLAKKLPNSEAEQVKDWADLYENPEQLETFLRRPLNNEQQRLARKVMHRLAWQNPDLSAQLWPQFVRQAKPTKDEQKALWRRFSIKAASDHHPNAEAWMAKAQLNDDDHYAWGWRMRAALAAEDWPTLLTLAQRPSTGNTLTDDGLRYWAAIAAQQLGQPHIARALLQKLALQRNWYGYLAADSLGLAYNPADPLPKSDATQRSLLLSHIEARRARDLRQAEVEWLARGEWRALLKVIPPELRQEAALFALEIDWPSMAARTQAVYTNIAPDETLFPLPWQPLVNNAAQENSVAPAHIWSQMRAESLFMPDVRSGAGAIGLMQLMPATARNVGKRLQLNNWRQLPLQDPATNIQLGSRYIAEMLERFDHHVPLAAAAYNAGPNRVSSWLEKREYSDPTRWVEMIPFTETRGYVQRALYFHTMYDRRLKGSASRLSDLLQASNTHVVPAAVD